MTPEHAVNKAVTGEYQYGFVTEIDSDVLPPGLDEEVIRDISARKDEPDWMLQRRLDAYRHWQSMEDPTWSHIQRTPVDFESISCYSAPKHKGDGPKSLDEVDPELLETYNKLGIPLEEKKALAGVAVDAVFDRVSVATTFGEELARAGVVFCSISEAVQQ